MKESEGKIGDVWDILHHSLRYSLHLVILLEKTSNEHKSILTEQLYATRKHFYMEGNSRNGLVHWTWGLDIYCGPHN